MLTTEQPSAPMPVLFSVLDTRSHLFLEPAPKSHVMAVQVVDFSATVETVTPGATAVMLDASAMAAMADRALLVWPELTESPAHRVPERLVEMPPAAQPAALVETAGKAVQSLAMAVTGVPADQVAPAVTEVQADRTHHKPDHRCQLPDLVVQAETAGLVGLVALEVSLLRASLVPTAQVALEALEATAAPEAMAQTATVNILQEKMVATVERLVTAELAAWDLETPIAEPLEFLEMAATAVTAATVGVQLMPRPPVVTAALADAAQTPQAAVVAMVVVAETVVRELPAPLGQM